MKTIKILTLIALVPLLLFFMVGWFNHDPSKPKSPKKDYNFVPRVKKYIDQETGEGVAKKFGLTYLSSGDRITGLESSTWCYSFLSRETLTPEQGDALIKKIHLALFEELYKNPDVSEFFRRREDVFGQDQIGVKITFWTKDYNRIKPPGIAQVSAVQGKYSYNFANEDDSLGSYIFFSSFQ